MDHSPEFLKLVEKAKHHIHEVSIAQVMDKQKTKSDFILVDVREDSEWGKGHLPGAIHLGKGIIERDIETAIPQKNRQIVLYCGGGYRSALSAESIQKMGYTEVYSMAGGFREWLGKNLPMETTP
jgi:rhodanese-related sulfurtransferase